MSAILVVNGMSRRMFMRLNEVWKIATAKATLMRPVGVLSPAFLVFISIIQSGKRWSEFQMRLVMTPMKRTAQMVPMTLNRKCARAARLAFTLAEMEASHAVTVVPMFSPSTMAAQLVNTVWGSSPSHPFQAHAMVMAMAADDD